MTDSLTEAVALKNCPLCNAEAVMRWIEDKPWFAVYCSMCGLRGPIHRASHGATVDEAVVQWNNRDAALTTQVGDGE